MRRQSAPSLDAVRPDSSDSSARHSHRVRAQGEIDCTTSSLPHAPIGLMTIRIAAIGITHSHIDGQINSLTREGATFVAWWSDEEDVAGPFAQRYPDAKRVKDRREILEDPTIHMVVTSAIPAQRAEIAVAAMRHGKDVMSDKPGMTTFAQLDEIKRVQAETGRIFSVCYSEHFETRATVKAGELVAGRRHRRGRQHRRPRTARAQQQQARALLLPARAVRRHPLRHREPPGRAVPVLCRHARRRDRLGDRRQPRAPRVSGPSGRGRLPHPHAARDRLCPGRLVHARRALASGATAASRSSVPRAISSSGNTPMSPDSQAATT